jgi:hypothetical protein
VWRFAGDGRVARVQIYATTEEAAAALRAD